MNGCEGEATASLANGNTAFAFSTQDSVAQAVLAPGASSAAVKYVLNAAGNTAIKAAFTPNGGFLAVGELGTEHATSGTAAETDISKFSETFDQKS